MSLTIAPLHKAAEITPSWYRGSDEMTAVQTEIDALFGALAAEIQGRWDNQYIGTANAEGLAAFEALLEIAAQPSDTLEFRRERVLNRFQTVLPFSLPFLKDRLDAIIGIGKWNVELDYGERTIVIETISPNQKWYQELNITLNKVLPANMVYINRPLINQTVLANERVLYGYADYYTIQGIWPIGLAPFRTYSFRYNYVLGEWHLGSDYLAFLTNVSDDIFQNYNYWMGKWELGLKPFGVDPVREVLNDVATPSLTDLFMQHHATFTVGDIAAVRFNKDDTQVVTDFTKKESSDNIVTLEYTLALNANDPITYLELLDANGNALSAMEGYVPRSKAVTIRHTIKFEEGVAQ